MSVAIHQHRWTAEDPLTMPDGERYELVGGALVEKQSGAETSWIATRVSRFLGAWAEERGLGWVFGGEAGYECFGPDLSRVRRPDETFVRRDRLPGGRVPRGHIPVPPDIAVEVVSPNDRDSEVDATVGEYLEAGVPLVWVIDPENRTVQAYEAGAARSCASPPPTS